MYSKNRYTPFSNEYTQHPPPENKRWKQLTLVLRDNPYSLASPLLWEWRESCQLGYTKDREREQRGSWKSSFWRYVSYFCEMPIWKRSIDIVATQYLDLTHCDCFGKSPLFALKVCAKLEGLIENVPRFKNQPTHVLELFFWKNCEKKVLSWRNGHFFATRTREKSGKLQSVHFRPFSFSPERFCGRKQYKSFLTSFTFRRPLPPRALESAARKK